MKIVALFLLYFILVVLSAMDLDSYLKESRDNKYRWMYLGFFILEVVWLIKLVFTA